MRRAGLPWDDLFQGMDDVFSRLDNAPSFEIDAHDEGGNIVIRADLPGVTKDDVNVTLEKGVLTISAKREAQKEEADGNVYVRERTYGDFSRSLRVPSDISMQRSKTEFCN
jgi:HSP20 family protein